MRHLHFRGKHAPASLKRAGMLTEAAAAGDFRGKHAPASLKPRGEGHRLVLDRDFRGKHAPASLKRNGHPRGGGILGGISGANMPRPH